MVKPVTAQELAQKLESDPEWVARRDRRNAETERKRTEMLIEQRPIIVDLRATGVMYESLGDTLHSPEPYPAAIPILLKHLQLLYSDRTRAMIARCLATKEARFAWDFLVDAYKNEPLTRDGRDSLTKDGLAVAIAATTTSERIDDLVILLRKL